MSLLIQGSPILELSIHGVHKPLHQILSDREVLRGAETTEVIDLEFWTASGIATAQSNQETQSSQEQSWCVMCLCDAELVVQEAGRAELRAPSWDRLHLEPLPPLGAVSLQLGWFD